MRPGIRIWPWAAAVFLVLWGWTASEDSGSGDGLQIGIICFNLETMRVTWEPDVVNLSFVFRFHPDQFHPEPFRPCPSYVLRGGVTSGCIFPAQLALLEYSIMDGPLILLNRKHLATQYLKPRSPGNLSFKWTEDAVRVTCLDLPHPGLNYEVQHRNAFDADWQSQEADTCNVTVQGLDAKKCYDFRARVTTRSSYYGDDTFPSDWADVTHWRGAQRTDSCLQAQPPESGFPVGLAVCGSLTLLMAIVLLLLLWRLQRVRNVMLPCVPDPRCSFEGLFEKHHGNFQDWIRDTQQAALPRAEGKGQDIGSEEVLVVQLFEVQAQPGMDPATRGAQEPCAKNEVPCAKTEEPCCLPRHGAHCADAAVSLGGFTFVMNENAYMVL